MAENEWMGIRNGLIVLQLQRWACRMDERRTGYGNFKVRRQGAFGQGGKH